MVISEQSAKALLEKLQHAQQAAQAHPVGSVSKRKELVQRIEHERELEQKYRACGIPKRYWHKGFDDFQTLCAERIHIREKFIDYQDRCLSSNHPGALIVLGDIKTGKTHLACALLKEVLNEHSGFYISFSDFIQGFYYNNERSLVASHKNDYLFIIDDYDMALNELSAFIKNHISGFFLHRFNELLPTVIISNHLEFDELGNVKKDSEIAEHFFENILGYNNLSTFNEEGITLVHTHEHYEARV